ncbi:tetratricopeptide repeat protein [Leptolyngbya sp. FACHB-541]|uniref:tetratricopeptide repeat protein n=1 Tax=Leptolyngbya sp. FACHB-541 TaxID=2692810 RepID=UPI001688CA3F|nr:tetratricopeptide repeat protein [Leptolyngbya sp. FACHB-541]MBD1998614.1 tetratricopeptide repeat protein [Leptolyngbya sp. FACHB-541]
MNASSNFAADDGVPFSLEQCRQRLKRTSSSQERLKLLCREGLLLMQAGHYEQAIASYEQALQLQPDDAETHHYRAVALENLGRYRQALAAYDQAIGVSVNPSAQLWSDRGNALRNLSRHVKALESYEKALTLQPDHPKALSGRGLTLMMMGRTKQALASCNLAVELEPKSEETWSSRGAVLLMAHRDQQALADFDKALELQPGFNRVWFNRGVALLRLGKETEAIASFEQALSEAPIRREVWHSSAWVSWGYVLLKLGQFERAIANFEKALELQPRSYPAALYKLIGLVLSGQFFAYATRPASRGKLLHDFGTVIHFLKYRLLFFVGLILLLSQSQGDWADTVRQVVPTLFSGVIIALLIADLWKNKSKLELVWKAYFQSGILTYFRAAAIIVITLGTYSIADYFAPPFMRWGWANLVFGQPGNIIFQPFNLFSSAVTEISDLTAPISNLVGAIALQFASALTLNLQSLGTQITENQATTGFNYSSLFIIGFWLLLLLGIPFWAKLEELIFRQGANTWKQILIRSTQFGLVHLLAGIPILGGFVLIVPGFLFACRYKYVHDRQLRKTADPLQAREAGVMASTADHAVYNAILVSFVASLFLQQSLG